MKKKSIEILIEIYSIPFDFQTLELISKSLQPSQNPVKDPRGTPEHGTSTFRRRGIWDFNLSSRIDEVAMDKNPTTYGVEAELGMQITALDWTCCQKEMHNGLHNIIKSFATSNPCKDNNTCSIQSCLSFDWVGRHRPNNVKVRKAILHHWHPMSWTIT